MSANGSTPPATLVDDASYQSFDFMPSVFRISDKVKSPYTDQQIISIDVGTDHTRFRVHRAILKQSPELDAKSGLKLWGDKSVSLPDLDEETAHTLVHFLYTGCYDTLKPRDAAGRSALSQYKLGTCVYCAAIRYKLPSLAELAKEVMIALQEDLTIFNVLVVARENAFPGLPEDDAWYSGYLEDAIHAARTKDADLFTRPEFVDQIKGDLGYRQIVMKAIVNSYSQPSRSTSVSVAGMETPKEQKPQSTLDSIVATSSLETGPLPIQDGEPVLEEINPTLETPVAPEPHADGLGWEHSKTFQSQTSDTRPTSNGTTAPRSGHARNDSVLDIKEHTAPVQTTSDKSPSVGQAVEAKASEVEVTVETKGVAVSPPVEEAKDVAGDSGVTSPITNEADANGAVAKKSKKKKKKSKGAAVEAAAVGAIAVPVN